jgi:hypothetical protein
MYVQYPDLTELRYPTPYEVPKTEFACYVKAITSCKEAEKQGMKPVSCMNNWWPTHCGENRTMTLYWMRVPTSDGTPQVLSRHRWHFSSASVFAKIEEHMGATGCGFKIGEPPLRVSLFHRFFTLMRMPVEAKPIQVKWLTLHNYRLIDTGKLASYWVNGWKPEEYSIEKEYEYFSTSQKEWRLHGMDNYQR